MVVDDEPQIGQMLTKFLGKHNYKAIPFTSGKEAIAYLKSVNEGEPRCLLKTSVDNDLYGRWLLLTAGIELARQAKTLYPTLPIIVMSSSADGRDRDEIFSLGADFIHKPFKLTDLLQLINSQITRSVCSGTNSGDARGDLR
jgi:two-component system response regulator HydG